MPDPEAGPGPDLIEAVGRAARHVGQDSDGERRPVVRFDPAEPGRGRLLVLVATLAIVSGFAGYLSWQPRGGPPLAETEEDLRWAVDQVVKRVEELWVRTGSRPAPRELHGLLSEFVAYEPYGDAYRIVAQRGAARVVHIGSIPRDSVPDELDVDSVPDELDADSVPDALVVDSMPDR